MRSKAGLPWRKAVPVCRLLRFRSEHRGCSVLKEDGHRVRRIRNNDGTGKSAAEYFRRSSVSIINLRRSVITSSWTEAIPVVCRRQAEPSAASRLLKKTISATDEHG